MVLADGLTYARQLGATHLIDAATLTGAISVALGKSAAGAFSNDDATYAKFEAALEISGEKFWRLPLGEEYADLIKSDIGDIKNTGGRYGGASIAAEFLHTFAEDTPWIHLDIAGTAWIEDARPYIAKGPSGIAVRSILEWVRASTCPRNRSSPAPNLICGGVAFPHLNSFAAAPRVRQGPHSSR